MDRRKKYLNRILVIIIYAFLIFVIIFFINNRKEKNIEKSKNNTANNQTEEKLPVDYYKKFDQSLGCNYYRKDKTVYYMYDQLGSSAIINIIPEADSRWAFTPLDQFYAKDKNFVYYMGVKVEGADPNSFIVLNLIKDKKESCQAKDNTLTQSFGLAKDANNFYHHGKIEGNIDVKTLELMGYRYLKTKDGIFITPSLPTDSIRKVELADPATFQVVNYGNYESYQKSNFDARDKRYYYKNGLIINQNNYQTTNPYNYYNY